MLITVITFLLILLLVCIVVYCILQAMQFLGITNRIPSPLINIALAILFLVLLWFLLNYFKIIPGLG